MAEPGKVDSLRFESEYGGFNVRVRRNRTQAETDAQLRRIIENNPRNYTPGQSDYWGARRREQVARIYGRTMIALSPDQTRFRLTRRNNRQI